MVDTYTDDRAIKLYAEFRSNLRTAKRLGVAPYPRPFEGGSFDILTMPFHAVAQDALREIANAINGFGRYIHSLYAWQSIYEKATGEDQYNLLLDHIRPLSSLCLTAPQALRGRLIHAATATSYHANLFLKWDGARPDWNGGHTSMKTAKSMSEAWPSWPALAISLSRMAESSFQEATSDFRNQHEHGHPRSIALGHINVIRRIETNGRIGWSFGQQEPMQLSELLPVIEQEHDYALVAFTAYLEMVKEQHSVSGSASTAKDLTAR
jgi:hypothetical protein